MSIAQSHSPFGDLQHLFSSPACSAATSSTSSLLHTPDNNMTTDPLHLHQASLNAAGMVFASITQHEDPTTSLHSKDSSGLVFAYNAPGTVDLGEALQLGYTSAEVQAAFAHGDVDSTLDKRPTTSYPASAYASMLRSRLDLNSGRRHSIQPLIQSTETDPTWSDYSSMTGPNVGARSMSLSVDPFASFSYHAAAPPYTMEDMSTGSHDVSGSGFLMSPPRLTVSILSGSSPTPTPFDGAADDAKRRRTSLVDATPERAVQQAAQLQHGSMPQQTPPNMFAYQQHPNFSFGSSGGAGLQTPASVQSSISPCRSRRLSLTAVDQASHIAHLTANLGLPAFSGGEQPPNSAPACAAGSDAMQQAQSQSQSQPRGGKKGSVGKSAAGKSSNSRKDSLSGSATTSTGNGKNQDVWPDDVEVAFWEALRLIPKLGRRKVLVHGKPCGRNELIADYIERKTNKKRSRKQVSSHIQVLKNIRKGDPEFQQLIAEPTTEEDFYIPAGGMMYAQTLAGYGYGNLGAAYPLLSVENANGGLLSPYTPGLAGGQGLASPLSPCPPPLSATHSITSGLNELHLPQQTGTKDTTGNTPCPILPASFSMWAHCSESDDKHVYTSLDRNSMTTYADSQSPLPQMTLDSVRLGHFRFPRLAEMYHRMPCQFVHVHVPLSVPRHDVMMPRYDSFSTQLSLTSAQDLRLTSVTTVYSHGKRALSLVEPLEAPRKISGRSSVDTSSTSTAGGAATAADAVASSTVDQSIAAQHDTTTSTPVKNKNTQRRVSDGSLGSMSPTSNTSSGPASPCTPLDASKQADGNLRHRWCHQAPFATDFWADFLSRNHPVNAYSGRDGLQSFGKEPSERAALGMAVSGVTIIQELVVAGEGAAAAAAAASATSSRDGASAVLNDAGSSLSPGSKVGDVVLVVAWDLECVEALGATPGVPTVSLLTAGPGLSPLGRAAPLASPLHHPALAGLQVNPHGLSPMTAALPGQPIAHQQQAQLGMLPGAPVLGGLSPVNPAPSVMPTQPSTQPSFGLNVQPASSDSDVQVPTLLRKRGLSMNKPNLMLNIPPASAYLNPQRTPNGSLLSPHPQLSPGISPTPAVWGMIQQRAVHTPITPFPQVGAGLSEPPPLNTGDDARAQKERLERHWAGQVNPLGGALPSPLDLSFNHGDMNAPSTSSAGMAVAAAVASPGVSALGLTVPSAGIHGGLPLLSPAGFDMGSKTHNSTSSGPSSFEQMLNEGSDASDAAITQEYLDGLLASIGVEGQDFSSSSST